MNKTQEERLNYLLEEFKADSDNYKNIEIPDNIIEKQNLLRSLMNIRMPKKMPDEVIKVQDEYLSHCADEKGIVKLSETVALLSKLDVDKHIDVEIKLDELDLTSAESKASYAQIKEYILEKFDLKVSTLYIAQIKKKCGIVLREHYNKSKKEKQIIPQCTPEKEEAIMDALRHFKMI